MLVSTALGVGAYWLLIMAGCRCVVVVKTLKYWLLLLAVLLLLFLCFVDS
jgi:hypothetical protein